LFIRTIPPQIYNKRIIKAKLSGAFFEVYPISLKNIGTSGGEMAYSHIIDTETGAPAKTCVEY
jgi:thiamine biosynthesis lipoprotein ApbE